MITRAGALAIVSGAALAIDAGVYAVALGSLASAGPGPFGYDRLALANHLAAVVAALLGATGVLLAVERRRHVPALLTAAALTTLVGAVGLQVLGRRLADGAPPCSSRPVCTRCCSR